LDKAQDPAPFVVTKDDVTYAAGYSTHRMKIPPPGYATAHSSPFLPTPDAGSAK